MPRFLQTSGSTRSSVWVSSERRARDVRRHSPEIPEPALTWSPISGARFPVRARQMTAVPVRSASAMPSAPVRIRALSVMLRNIDSGGRVVAERVSRSDARTATGSSCGIGECDVGGGTGIWSPGALEAGSGKWPMTLLTLARFRTRRSVSNQQNAEKLCCSLAQIVEGVNVKPLPTRTQKGTCRRGTVAGISLLRAAPGCSRRYNDAKSA